MKCAIFEEHSSSCVVYSRFSGTLFPVSMIDGESVIASYGPEGPMFDRDSSSVVRSLIGLFTLGSNPLSKVLQYLWAETLRTTMI